MDHTTTLDCERLFKLNTSAQLLAIQKASVAELTGQAQIIRDGFFLTPTPGMELLSGDRISASDQSVVKIQFEGTPTHLVIGSRSTATLVLQETDPNQPPQWLAGDLFGEQVYFDTPLLASTSAGLNDSVNSVSGEPFAVNAQTSLGGHSLTESGHSGFPFWESLMGAAGAAAVYSGSQQDEKSQTVVTPAAIQDSGNVTNSDSQTGTTPAPTSMSGTNASNSPDNMKGVSDNGSSSAGETPATNTPTDSPPLAMPPAGDGQLNKLFSQLGAGLPELGGPLIGGILGFTSMAGNNPGLDTTLISNSGSDIRSMVSPTEAQQLMQYPA